MNTNLMFATRARKSVENSRLLLDAAKAKAKNGGWKMPGQAPKDGHDEEMIGEEARVEIEQAEDEFVGQTEEAVGVMKNACLAYSVKVLQLTDYRSLIPLNLSEILPT